MTHERAPLSRGVAVTLTVIVVGSLVAAFLFGIYGDPVPSTAGANTFSRSAIGHQALTLLLEEHDVPYVVSRFQSAQRARDANALLVVLEPTGLDFANDRMLALREMVETAPQTLVVMPKRVGRPDPDRPGHLASVDFVRGSELAAVLDALELPGASMGFHQEDAPPVSFAGMHRLGEGLPWPAIDELQVVIDPKNALQPVVRTEDGILLGRLQREDRVIWLLSDPDLLQTHGLVRADNAQIVLAMLGHVRAGRTLIFDETLHGFELPPSLARELGTFPLGLATLQVLLLVAAAVWFGAARFGSPRPVAARSDEAPGHEQQQGMLALVENTAAVLTRSSHGGATLHRYLQMTEREVARALNAPTFRSHTELAEWLATASQTRGARTDLRALRAAVQTLTQERRTRPESVVELAERIHRWKQETLRGT